jgi:hypothetical protein
MKIYTYYENVNFNKQLELIDVWKESWRMAGFEPVVLNRGDAKKCPLYQEYYDFVQEIHMEVSNRRIPENDYWLAAQLEIAAFTTIDEASFISDYDVINNGFRPPEDLSDILHWRDAACSCFASGSGNSFLEYIKFLFKNKKQIIDFCSEVKSNTNRDFYGDQDFLIAVREFGVENGIFEMTRDPEIIGKGYDPNGENNCKAIHISHRNVGDLKKENKEFGSMSLDDIRIHCAKKLVY